MRILAPMLLAIATFLPVFASDVGSEANAVQRLKWLETANASADAQRDIDSGTIKFLGLPGVGTNIPYVGALSYSMCYREHADLEFLPTGGCVIWGPEHSRLTKLAYDYAKQYNAILDRYLTERGRSNCSADVDWGGAWAAISQYLRSDRKRERSFLAIGPDEVHVYLNRYRNFEKVAGDICDLLRSHGLDRSIAVVITPRELINTPAVRDRLYRLECRASGMTSNTGLQTDDLSCHDPC